MQRENQLSPLDEANIKRNTKYSKMRTQSAFNLAHNLINDPERERRLKQFNCPHCYYAGKGMLAGQAMTNYNCANCNGIEMHSNTNTPKYCTKCAKEHNVCVRCGGEVDQNNDDENLAFSKIK